MLELAIWKANLIKNDDDKGEEKHPAKRAKIIDECGDTYKGGRYIGRSEE